MMDEALWRQLLDRQSDVVWCLQVAPEVRFEFVSEASTDVLGYSPQALLDDVELFFRRVHLGDVGLLGIAGAPRGSVPAAGEVDEEITVRFLRPDDEQRWIEVRTVWVAEGSVERVYGVTRDVTDRTENANRVERANLRLGEAEVLAGVGTYDWNIVSGDIWFSGNLYRILGQDAENWTPSYPAFEAMLLDQHRDNAREAIEHAAVTGHSFSDNVEVRRPDGSIRMLDVIALVELDEEDQLSRVHGVMKDITAERQNERTRLLFLADAAHELRTPVAGVVGASTVLRRRLTGSDQSEDVTELLNLLDRQAGRLRGMISSLVDLSRFESRLGAVELTAVDVDEIVARAVDATRPPEHLVVHVEPSGQTALAEPWRFERIIVNLLTNAYRYANHRITVSGALEGDGVVVTVTDDGPGVAATDVVDIFSAFHRGVGEHGLGSGLGLALARRMAETQDSDLTYRKADGGGACFALRLRHP